MPPRPILVKLSTAWDCKLALSRRVKLKEFHIKRLFLREDVAPDHRLCHRPSALPSDKATISSSGARLVSAFPARLLPHSGASGGSKIHPSLLPTPLSRSVSPVASSQSVSPSASTASSSSSSSSTIIQDSDGPHGDAT